MKHLLKVIPILVIIILCPNKEVLSQTGKEIPLWPEGIPDNPVVYEKELVREASVSEYAPSKTNRVFSAVSNPEYLLIQADKNKANGVAVVICPGGGFRDVWFDREGVDFALWLAEKGITSLVLKYRTYNPDAEGFSLSREIYNGEVYADAKQAIHLLRSQSIRLNIDPDKIGIAGYSAGGALSLFAALEIFEDVLPSYAKFSTSTHPDFACLIYPGISNKIYEAIEHKRKIPPIFMINGAEDDVTPADRCLKLYAALLDKNIPAELHIYARGNHGFDSGIGRGHGVASWQHSFVYWLKDMSFIE